MTSYSRSSSLTQHDLSRFRRWFLILVAVLLWITSGLSARADDDADDDTEHSRPVVQVVESQPYVQHGITITPARSTKVTVNGLSYDEVYNSIPYHRADSSVNPGYRHDATMEILFGELRDTTIVRNMPVPATQQTYARPFYGYGPYGGGYTPIGGYIGRYSWRIGNYGLNSYGLSPYRWSLWDNFMYRHAAFMFGVR